MRESNTIDAIDLVCDVLALAVLLAVIITASISHQRNMDNTVISLDRREGVSLGITEEKNKNLLEGTSVISEIMTLPDDIYVKVNATVLNTKMTDTGVDYITYAKQYGVELLEQEIAIHSMYEKSMEMDENGNVIGVWYLLK